ncbi:hypothetical protein K2173_020895 [Erythroxylum novogranatense]|uniref:Uncharacterized protein n=1 Tax=Erythroxylum novogranatense TaxID=1862640 RepID=A0AAV8TPN7_9ROSI|nr:hypothetical protein K2173_020895 [Erythroxylum novogranatense]
MVEEGKMDRKLEEIVQAQMEVVDMLELVEAGKLVQKVGILDDGEDVDVYDEMVENLEVCMLELAVACVLAGKEEVCKLVEVNKEALLVDVVLAYNLVPVALEPVEALTEENDEADVLLVVEWEVDTLELAACEPMVAYVVHNLDLGAYAPVGALTEGNDEVVSIMAVKVNVGKLEETWEVKLEVGKLELTVHDVLLVVEWEADTLELEACELVVAKVEVHNLDLEAYATEQRAEDIGGVVKLVVYNLALAASLLGKQAVDICGVAKLEVYKLALGVSLPAVEDIQAVGVVSKVGGFSLGGKFGGLKAEGVVSGGNIAGRHLCIGFANMPGGHLCIGFGYINGGASGGEDMEPAAGGEPKDGGSLWCHHHNHNSWP